MKRDMILAVPAAPRNPPRRLADGTTLDDPAGVECEDAELVMAAREARTLSSREEAQFLGHLATCERCRQASQVRSEDEWRWLARVPQENFGDADGLRLPTVDPGVFEVERELASGGMGRILLARDRRLDRVVAIKEVLDRDLHARFEREALITARLQHPAIVPIYEAGTWPDGSGFYTMRLVPGGTLNTAIAGAKQLPDRLALLHHVVAMTEAVAYAHDHRIIHRDLKPQNVLVGDLGETVVIDWGLAKELDRPESVLVGMTSGTSSDLTRIGAVMGTPGFMAPEQARGEAIDERADVYALGSILYTLLAGAPPYAEHLAVRDADALVEIGAAGPPRSIDELAPDAPPDLRAIVARAMARDPAARYPTAREMAEELRRFEAGKLIARQYSVRELVGRWIKRHRAAVAVGLIALVVVIAVGALAILNVSRSRSAERVARQIAERARDASEASFAALLEEHGRSATMSGELDRGLVYLSEALARGRDTTTLRHFIAVVMRDGDLQRAELKPLNGYVSDIAFLADAQVAVVESSAEFKDSNSPGQLTIWKGETVTGRHALGGELASAVFGPGAKSLAVVGLDHAFAMWDVATGTRRWILEDAATEDVVDRVRFDPSGTRVAFASHNSARTRVFDVATGATLATLESTSGTVNDMAFSPDGHWIAACGSEGDIQVWSASTYALHASWKAPLAQRRIVFTDARHVLTIAKTVASLWTIDQQVTWLVSHDTDIVEVAVAPHGDLFATSDTRGIVRTWTLAGRSAGTSHTRAKVRDLRFSPDGSLLLGGSSGEQLIVWDTATLDVVKAFAEDTTAIAWSSDGALFAAGLTADYARVWARPIGSRRGTFPSTTSIFTGDQVLTQDKQGLVLRARATGVEVARLAALPGEKVRGSWQTSRDGRRMLDATDDRVTIVELPSGRQVATLESEDAILSADGRRIVMLDYIDTATRVRIADAATGTMIATKDYPTAGPVGVAISDDGSSLVVLHKDKPWEVRDADTLALRSELPGSVGATEAVYDPTGRIVLYGRNNYTVTVHHATTGAVIGELTTPKDIERAEISVTGTTLAFEYENGVVEVYELGSPRPRALVKDTARGAFALTPDGTRLATGHSNGDIQIWDTSTGRPLEVLRGHRRKIASLEFSSDGTFLLADVTDGTASVWEIPLDRRTAAEIAALAERAPWKLVDGALVPRR